MVEAINLCKEYGRKKKICVLNNVNLRVDKGEFVAVMGPSGSGKTTLMNILGCLDKPTSGKYILNGQDTSRMGENQLADFRNKTIGFVFQSFFLLPQLTALENIEVPLFYSGVPASKRRKKAWLMLERIGLLDRSGHFPSELSGGQRQRVAIGRALINNPMIILADEPTGNLDQKSGESIMRLFSDLNKMGKTVVVITHDSKVASCAKKLIHIEDGWAFENGKWLKYGIH